MELSSDDILHAILRGWGIAVRKLGQSMDIGPFLVTLDPDSQLPWLNYALPIRPEASDGDLVATLPLVRAEFERRQRPLRFEILGDLFPSLPVHLQAEGLVLQFKLPLMACTAAELQPTVERGVHVELLAADAPDAELGEYIRLRDAAFGAPPSDELEIQRLRDQLVAGRARHARAFLGNALAGVGALLAGGEVTELVAVATHPDARRRGVAGALSLFLVRDHLQRGGTAVWLSAADDAARAVYTQIGFRRIGWQLNYGTSETRT